MPTLALDVNVRNPADNALYHYSAGDSAVPDWAQRLISNPAAWVGGVAPYPTPDTNPPATIKAPVRAATTADITLSGTQTIDGVTLVAKDSVLVKNQTAGADNGVYVVASGAWKRRGDLNTGPALVAAQVAVLEGGQAETEWIVTTPDPITLGTTVVTWAKIAAATVHTHPESDVTGLPADLAAKMTAFNDRGTVQYATTYAPGDVIVYNGERVYITAALTTGAGTNGLGQPFISAAKYQKLTSLGWFWASDYGVVADGATDDWPALQALLILVRSLSTNSNNGYRVALPSGQVMLSKTLIVPTQTTLIGQGLYSTVLKIMTGANCDVVQPERYNNSAQAALLTPLQSSLTAGNLRNAFRWGLRDLTIHGNSGLQSATDYHHGLNVQTNPLTTLGTGDPDFDPGWIVENVQFRACSGDGFFANGRSGGRLTHCIAWFNLGNGFTPSFDTQLVACQAGFNGMGGFYFNHASNQGAANKSYNNGQMVAPWTTGQTWAAGARVIYNGVVYGALNATTNDTATPDTDPTNWGVVATTSVAAWGVGCYFDANSGEITWDCDCQQNSASNWVFKTVTSRGIRVSGCSDEPNYNNQTSALNGTNPNNYAAVVLDACQGIIVAIASRVVGTAGFHLRIVNGATKNDVTLAGDTSGALLSGDSTAILGSGNQVRHNGVNYTQTLALLNDAVIASPVDGQALIYSGGAGKWQNALPAGSTFYGGIFGDGSDGSATLDGAATVAWATLAGSTYTLTRDCFTTALTINSGVTVILNGYRLFCQGAVNNAGTISAAGLAGTATTGGASSVNGFYGQSNAGGAGGIAALGSAGQAGGYAVGSAGAGGNGSSTNGGAAGGASGGSTFSYLYRTPQPLLVGYSSKGAAAIKAAPGGGGGGGDNTNRGGGGGSGGGIVAIFAFSFVNSGTVSAKGGDGFVPTTGNCGGGGGGGGGLIVLYTLAAWTNTGTTNVAGGTGAAGVGTGTSGANGSSGVVVNFVLT